MHIRASNYELVKPLPEPERTLNRRLRRRNKRVPFDQRNNPPQHSRIVYPQILNINYFRHFLDILRNYDLMDDEPMWAADRVAAPTLGSAITIPKTTNEFVIKGSKILHSIEGTLLEEEIFSEFDKFIAMVAIENYNSESDEEEPKFEKITINTYYKIKTSLEEPPMDLELKPLPDNLEYVFLEEPSFLPVIISSQLSAQNKSKLVSVLKNIKKHLPEKQQTFLRRLNLNMQEVVKKEIMKLLDTGIIYPIADSLWEATAKDHFPLPFMDQMLKRLARNKYLCFLDGFSGYFQIPIDPMDQEKTTFVCPFGTYAYRRMSFGLCNAPATFQRCVLAIFHDMIKESVEVFMDDFFVFGNSFDKCLNNLDKMLQHCKDAHLVLNWEKCHFMVKEGIVLEHKVSGAGFEFDKVKIGVISKLPPLPISKVLEAFLDMPVFIDDS
nr:reverse transcriptase domain-containing protein [Tanacetum cinerariifolium]